MRMTYQQTRTENQWWQGESQHCVTRRQTTTIWTFTTDTETSGQWSNSKSPVYLNIIPDNAECLMWRGCGGCQLPNSITNYQQHFTIIRGNNPNPNTANRWRGSFGAGKIILFAKFAHAQSHLEASKSSIYIFTAKIQMIFCINCTQFETFKTPN